MGEVTTQAMATLLNAALEEDGMTQAEFCRRSGASAKHVNEVLRGRKTAAMPQLDYWAFILGRRFTVALEPRGDR